MSYCVNCGVELETSLRKCPLCECPVINPLEILDIEGKKPIDAKPNKIDTINNSAERRLTALVISVLIALPVVVCLLVELVYSRSLSWSLLVTGALAVVWVMCVPPVLFRGLRVTWAIIADGAAVIGFLWLLERAVYPGWFMPIAFPIAIMLLVSVVVEWLLISRDVVKNLYVAALIFINIALFVLGIEMFIDVYLFGKIALEWSWFAFIPCAGLAVLMFVIEKVPGFKESFEKRFHV